MGLRSGLCTGPENCSGTLLSVPVLNNSGSVEDGAVASTKVMPLLGNLGTPEVSIILRKQFPGALINGVTPLIIIAPRKSVLIGEHILFVKSPPFTLPLGRLTRRFSI